MNTKEIVKTIENLTGLYFEISINDNQTEVASTFNPEKINHEYFNICNELESYFTELYLDSNNLILERILYLLNDGLKLWNRLKKESFNINLNFENKELKNLETKLTDAELLRIAEIKTHYIQNLISRIENLTGTPKSKALPPQPIVESPFSVLEWATIFYYADETKLLSESPLLKTRLEQFMSKHQINTTFDNFKTKYYEAKKRINEKNDYPINKLELIIPFLKENYKQTVTKVENDIIFLEENKPEY